MAIGLDSRPCDLESVVAREDEAVVVDHPPHVEDRGPRRGEIVSSRRLQRARARIPLSIFTSEGWHDRGEGSVEVEEDREPMRSREGAEPALEVLLRDGSHGCGSVARL